MERKCLVCDNIVTGRGQFCCNKCKQKYYYEKNKEQRTQYKKEHYQEHKEEYIERALDWKEKNKERWREFHANYMRLVRQKAKEEKERTKQCEKCEKVDNHCREEKLTCKGCAYNKKGE